MVRLIACSVLDMTRQPLQGSQRFLDRCRDGRRNISRHPVPRQVSLQFGKAVGSGGHYVVPGAPVDVNIKEARGQHGAGKLQQTDAGR